MVWYGVMWYGLVWGNVVWSNVVWYGVVWCNVVLWRGVVVWDGIACLNSHEGNLSFFQDDNARVASITVRTSRASMAVYA